MAADGVRDPPSPDVMPLNARGDPPVEPEPGREDRMLAEPAAVGEPAAVAAAVLAAALVMPGALAAMPAVVLAG